MFKRSFLALGAGLLGALCISLLQSPDTSAASAYDTVIKPSSDMVVSGKPVTHTWRSYLDDENLSNCSPEQRSDISSAITSGSYALTLFQSTANWSNGATMMIMLWTSQPVEVTWQFSGSRYEARIYIPSGSKAGNFVISMNSNTNQLEGRCHDGFSWNNMLGGSNGDYIRLFESTFLSNYPMGYEGENIPGPRELTRPDFVYSVANKSIKAKDYNIDLPEYTPDEGWTTKGWQVAWHLFKCKEWKDISQLCTEPELVNSQFLKQSSDYRFEVSEYGDYKLSAGYRVETCYRYPSYPDTPDYCIILNLVDTFDGYDFNDTSVHLRIDGNSLSGDTKNMVCDISGSCESRAKMCYLETTFIKRISCEFNDSVSIGVLNPSINAFKDILQSLTVPNNPTCNVPMGNVTVAGRVFPLSSYSSNACQKVSEMRDAFPILSVLTNFMLAMLWLYLVVRMVNKLTDNTQHELIEGIKS